MTALRPATLLMGLIAALPTIARDVVALPGFAMDRSEVSIARFDEFARATGRMTAAEREGGGYEWGQGWERRPGWTFRQPFGETPANPQWPAVHVSWQEASDFCRHAGGRLPTRSEWTLAAYTEQGPGVADGFRPGQVYPFPTGDTPAGANTSGSDPWPRLAPVATTKRGVNGLYDMGANAWEWLADREADKALTAGGSWWYGPEQMRAGAMQWKPADFYVVYIGFRCVYDSTGR